MAQSPLAQVKDKFGSKEDLVKAVKALSSKDLWVDRLNADKGLERVSNKNLLELHAKLSEAKEKFGTRSALIDAVVEGLPHGKTKGFRETLEEQSTPKLLDLHRANQKRARNEAKKSAKKS